MEKLKNAKMFWVWLAAVFILGVILGWAAYKILNSDNNNNKAEGYLIREGQYKLTNPLIACEVGNQDQFSELQPMRDKISKLVNEEIGNMKAREISVYFRVSNTGKWVGVNEEKKYAPASLLKVVVVMAYFNIADSHPEILSKQIMYTGKESRETKAIDNQVPDLVPGNMYTVQELIQKMIIDSSNAALYVLVDNLGADVLKQTFSDLHLPIPKDATEASLDYMSPETYSLVFRILYGASYMSQGMSEKALEILSRTKFNDGLVAGVPSTVAVAHKFGSRIVPAERASFAGAEDLELHDCGIIFYPDNPYLLCVMTRGRDAADSESVIADISKLVYNEFAGLYPRQNNK